MHMLLFLLLLLMPVLAYGQTTNSRTLAGDGTPISDTTSGRLDVTVQNPVVISDGAGALNVIVDSGTVTTITNPVTVTDGAGAFNVIVDSGSIAVTGTTFDGIIKDGTGDTTQANVSGGRLAVDPGTVTITDGAGALNVIVDSGTITTITNPVTVTDGSGSLNVIVDSGSLAVTGTTFDGILKDGTGDTTQANVSSGRLHVDGSGVTQPVSGTVTVTDGAGALNVICDSGCGGAATFEDNDAFTADTTAINVMGALYDTTPPSITDGNAGAVRMNSSRVLMVDGSGVTQPISAASLPLPTGAATAANQDGIIRDGSGDTTQANVSSGRLHVDGSGVTQPVSGTVTVTDGSGALNVIVDSGTITSITNAVTITDGSGALNVICDSGCGGAATFEDNDAFTFNTTAVNNMGAVVDDTSTNTVTENSAGAVRMSTNRILYANPTTNNGTALYPTPAVTADDQSDPTVTAIAAYLICFDGTTWDRCRGTIIDTDDNSIAASQATSLVITETYYYNGTNWVRNLGTGTAAADGAAVSGNPVRIAGKDGSGNTQDIITDTSGELQVDVLTLPNVTIGTFPDNEPFNQNQRGGTAVVAGRCEREEPIYLAINQTGNTQLATGTASERIYICSLHVNTATAQNVALVSGTGSTCGTSTAGLEGFGGATAGTGWNFAANGGIVLPATTQAYGRTDTNQDNLCLFQSGAGQVSGGLTYVSLAP